MFKPEKFVIETIDLSIGYKRSEPILKKISIKIPHASLIAIIGRNGTGKSTLFRTLVGLLKPINGQIIIENKELNKFSNTELAHKIAFISTEQVRVNHLNVYDLVAMGRFPYTGLMNKLTKEDHDMVSSSLEKTGMLSFAYRNINKLSDGERQRVMIARALAQDTPLIILDEPTAFLDIPGRLAINNLLKDLSLNEKKTILFSTHDLEMAMKNVDYFCVAHSSVIELLSISEFNDKGYYQKVFS